MDKMEKFDFNGLTFTDRHTYHKYKDIKDTIRGNSNNYTVEFIVGLDDHCIEPIRNQLSQEGIRTDTTLNNPFTKYDFKGRPYQCVYLTVLNSKYSKIF